MTITILLILINLILFYYFKRKEIKNFFIKKQIREINIEEVHEIFKTNTIKTKFPTKNYITKFFVIPDHFNVVGMTSCLLYTSPSPRDVVPSRMPSSA